MDLRSRASLASFRETHPLRRLGNVLHGWQVIVGGGHGPRILLLAGVQGSDAIFFEYVLGLEDECVVIVRLPPPMVDTIDGALNGLITILDEHGPETAHIFGHSQSGYLAQELARRKPDYVRSLILSGTCLPGKSRALKIERQLRLLPLVPDVLSHYAMLNM